MAALVPTTMWMRHCTTVIFLQLFKFGHDFVRRVTDINFGPGLAWSLRPSFAGRACPNLRPSPTSLGLSATLPAGARTSIAAARGPSRTPPYVLELRELSRLA
jgi:hypothetical protein